MLIVLTPKLVISGRRYVIMKINLRLQCQLMRWCLSVLSVINFAGCAKNSIILTESDVIYLIPKGVHFTAIFNSTKKEYVAEQDRYVIAKGNYFDLVRCCNNITK